MFNDKLTWDQASHTLKLIEDQRLNQNEMFVLHNGLLSTICRAIKTGNLPNLNSDAVERFFGLKVSFEVDYSIPLPKLIKDGNYDDLDGNAVTGFLVRHGEPTRTNKKNLLGKFVPAENYTFDFLQRTQGSIGFRPATNLELLHLGLRCPDVQQKIKVYSVSERNLCKYLCLSGSHNPTKRKLELSDEFRYGNSTGREAKPRILFVQEELGQPNF